VLPLELSNLGDVKSFAEKTLNKIGSSKLDYLMLNAAMAGGAAEYPGPKPSKWSEPYIVNHLCEY
jgi:hypothetical protein